ncbi:hypothetical protein [Nocardia sp. NPDC049149]|uniref:hypothetical protein n=1 Tax=Nocardia sp. NPDC049149 TaxID=3364315 RepID=UPI003722A078
MLLKLFRATIAATVLALSASFGYFWWTFGRPDWMWNGPETIAISWQRFAVNGPYPDSENPWVCLADRQSIPMTHLEYCRVEPPEASMAVLYWYGSEFYTFNIQDPLTFP